MYDAALTFSRLAEKNSGILDELSLGHKNFFLATVHRQENTDAPDRLKGILEAFKRLAEAGHTLVWPLHPRLKGKMTQANLPRNIMLIEPLSFLDMVRLEMSAKAILTDSGGVQKEAYFHQTPCVTLRDETEWVETVEAGWNCLAGTEPDRIMELIEKAGPGKHINEYGDGRNGSKIAKLLIEELLSSH
jgi:UDP-GlcNAc3NAcA epimerase